MKKISEDQLQEIIDKDLKELNETQMEFWNQSSVPIQPIKTHYKTSKGSFTVEFFVVAKKGNEVMYFNDFEEGFNIAKKIVDGVIIDAGAEEDTIGWAINKWR